ncbi:MAG: cysteine-rich small domain-containing protein [Oscillospiraceae bacterium]|jgi:Zn-finger protein|nr:cysteine-rich small domain-containing protein [Oscillospiraceae bacterium]
MNETYERKAFFFSHKECEYFPCHKTDDPDNFNCLFCYCPLYALGERCGGGFTYTESGIKNCAECLAPHNRSSAQYIGSRFKELAELAKRIAPT